ncbi:unnamed protein product, partial [Amoebophrya sp. A25]
FGREQTETFLQRNKLALLLRSHEVPDNHNFAMLAGGGQNAPAYNPNGTRTTAASRVGGCPTSSSTSQLQSYVDGIFGAGAANSLFGPLINNNPATTTTPPSTGGNSMLRGPGYQSWHGGQCYTIFSASNYCGTTGNRGAVGLLTRTIAPARTSFWDHDSHLDASTSGAARGGGIDRSSTSPTPTTMPFLGGVAPRSAAQTGEEKSNAEVGEFRKRIWHQMNIEEGDRKDTFLDDTGE